MSLETGSRWLKGEAVWATISRRRNNEWTKEKEPERWDCLAFWEWIAALSHSRTRVWVIANRADEFLTLSRFWEACENGIVGLMERPDTIRTNPKKQKGKELPWVGAFVMGQRVTIVEGVGHAGRFMVCSTANWLMADSLAICEATGVEVPAPVGFKESGSRPPVPAKLECIAWHRWMKNTVKSYIHRGLGNWQPTAAAMAVSIWAATDGKGASKRHHNTYARQLEAGALHGGRADVWFYGHVGPYLPPRDERKAYPDQSPFPSIYGPAEKFDVVAMYPSLLMTKTFPRQLGGFWERPKLNQLAAWCRHECAIASVRLRTSKPEYPRKRATGTNFPVGEFTTTLAGPELELAIEEGAVIEVFAGARYIPGEPFEKWGKAVLDWRAEEKANGNISGTWFAKQVGNSFAGKFAQRSKMWIDRRSYAAPFEWGEWQVVNAKTGKIRRFRAVAGRSRELVEMLPGRRLPAAVFAYLTAYGRVQMRKYREACDARRILYQCTDSLLYLRGQEMAQIPPSWNVGTAPGQLRPEGQIESLRLFDPNHWFGDGSWTLAGVPAGWWSDGRSVIRSVHRVNPATCGSATRPESIGEIVRDAPLCRIPTDVEINPDGWMRTPHVSSAVLPEEVPFAPGWVPTLFADHDGS